MSQDDLQFKVYLGSENVSIGGQVEHLMCVQCRFTTFTLGLYADTNMVYSGIVSLTDLEQKRLLITHLNYSEFNNYHEMLPDQLNNRINTIFNADSFRYFKLQQYPKNGGQPQIFRYPCPKCYAYLEKTGHETFESFVKNGGVLLTLDVYQER